MIPCCLQLRELLELRGVVGLGRAGAAASGSVTCCRRPADPAPHTCLLPALTRPETAVAVPATTAVLAAMPTRPGPLRPKGISLSSPRRGQRRVARGLDDFVWKPLEVEQLAAGIADRLRDVLRPHVLPDEQRGGRVGLELLAGGLQVLLVEEAVHLDAHVLEALSDLGVDVGQLERGDVAVRVLPTKARSMIRIVPFSTRSASAGAISPRNSLPGKATIM